MVPNRKAFTLIELLVVIAIIAILAAILFPVFAQAKLAAKKSVDLSNVKQITTAQFLYMGDWEDTVAFNRDCSNPGGPACTVGRGYRGWIDLVSPYVKNYDIFKSPLDSTKPAPLPANTLDWTGAPMTQGIVWGPWAGTPLGGDFRSSYARNNNFANNGTNTANMTSLTAPATTVLIYRFAPNSGGGANGNERSIGSSFTIVRRRDITPEAGTCTIYNPSSTGNHRSNFFANLPAHIQALESAGYSSESGNGGASYGFADGHAKAFRPEKIKGQCGWNNSTGADFGNDGSNPDFRF